MPRRRPVVTKPSEQHPHRASSERGRKRSNQRRWANQVWLDGVGARGGDGVRGEETDQDQAVGQRDPGLERKDEGVHRRGGEEE